MKIKPIHIKRFEAFIQNSKDPNDKDTETTKNDKKSTPADEDEEAQDDSEEESDPIEEMKIYFAKQEKNYSQLWKFTI
jgi:hypothetical protein